MLGRCIIVNLSSKFLMGGALMRKIVVNASRTILFDVHSNIGLNFGILFAWAAVNTALFPLTCYFMRWKTMKEKKKEAESKNE
jgi:hypothetical protein